MALPDLKYFWSLTSSPPETYDRSWFNDALVWYARSLSGRIQHPLWIKVLAVFALLVFLYGLIQGVRKWETRGFIHNWVWSVVVVLIGGWALGVLHLFPANR